MFECITARKIVEFYDITVIVTPKSGAYSKKL